jgi:uncharacterized protein YcaQ
MALMLMLLNDRGEVAVVGRRQGQRVWDLAERWYPEVERIPGGGAAAARGEALRASASGSERGRLLAHPTRRPPVPPRRVTFLSPSTGSSTTATGRRRCGASRTDWRCTCPQAKREYGYYVLPILRGDRIVGRIEPVHDRKTGCSHVRDVWWEDGVRPFSLDRRCGASPRWLGATIA